MSRLAQLNMLIITCIVVAMEGCVIDYGNRINSLEGQVDVLRRDLTHMQNQQFIKESRHHRVDREASGE